MPNLHGTKPASSRQFQTVEALGYGHIDCILRMRCEGHCCQCHILPGNHCYTKNRQYFFRTTNCESRWVLLILFGISWSSLMVWDNFQRGQVLREQRASHSSKFLIGTVEAAHCVILFLNVRWNNHNVFMKYNQLQSHPSPLGMRSYESIDLLSSTFGSA